MSFKNKQMLITGAHGALGTVVASKCKGIGWNVSAPSMEELDVTDSLSVAAYLDTLTMPIGAVVHLVGGITTARDVTHYTDEDFQKMFSLNMLSAFNIIRGCFTKMKQTGGGSIVTIGAQSVLHPVGGRSLYTASKAAVASFTLSVAQEGIPYSIRTNCILPSILKTDANMEWAEGNEHENWITPEEIAETITHLCDTSCGVNGAVIPMFGKIPY
jgi:NAD(P)-dependent dehydrogenase (short-subunit alcohol dehydrogenase family)